jgi:predicted nucleotidyltransferase
MTQLTLADYEQAIDGFAAQLAELGDDLLAVFLFGSMARGEAVAGYSDLDFWIFLATAVFDDETRFTTALQTIIDAHHQMGRRGIPVSNAGCYASQANVERLPAMLLPNLQSENASWVILGQNIRQQMKTTPESRQFNGASTFFEMRRQFYHPLAQYLGRDSLSTEARWEIYAGLQYIKYLPEAVCAPLDLWPGEHGAIAVLTERWPDEAWGIVAQVKSFCAQHGPAADVDQLLANLRQTLLFVERLNDKIVTQQR